MAKTRWSDRLFRLWVVVGLLWVVATLVCYFKCPKLGTEQYIRFAYTKDPPLAAKKHAQYEAYDQWAPRLIFLANGSLGVSLLGVLLLFRRGCIVFAFAVGLVFVCQVAMMDATWIAP